MTKRHFIGTLAVFAFLTSTIRAEDFFFDSAGVRIHYTVQGRGEPVVLIHGFGADIIENWAKPGIVRALAGSYRVIALDNRGHGLSDKPHTVDAYRGQMAEDVIRLLDHLKIGQAHIVGYSMGGFITMALLGTHPERLRSAVIGAAGWNPAGLETWKRMIESLADSLEQGKGLGPLVTMLGPSGGASPGAEPIEAANRALMEKNDPLALAAVIRAMFADQPSEATLRANKVPVLALVGEVDLMRSWAEMLARTAPHVELVTISGANHVSAVSNPQFLSNVEAFLGRHSGR
jgi:pimeloyl-ACP methyl ester carboxylesterase